MRRRVTLLLCATALSCDAAPPTSTPAQPVSDSAALRSRSKPGVEGLLPKARYYAIDIAGDLPEPSLSVSLGSEGRASGNFQPGPRSSPVVPLSGHVENRAGTPTIVLDGQREMPVDGKRALVVAHAEVELRGETLSGFIAGTRGDTKFRTTFSLRQGYAPRPKQKTQPTMTLTDGVFIRGRYTGTLVEAGKFEAPTIRLRVDANQFAASFQGKVDGKGFSIPMSGRVAAGSDPAKLAGNRGPNHARLELNVKDGRVRGTISGKLWHGEYSEPVELALVSVDGPADTPQTLRPGTSGCSVVTGTPGFEDARIKLTVNEDRSIEAIFQGEISDGFFIIMKGTSDGAKFSARATDENVNVRLRGQVEDGNLGGEVQGSIGSRGFRAEFQCEPNQID